VKEVGKHRRCEFAAGRVADLRFVQLLISRGESGEFEMD